MKESASRTAKNFPVEFLIAAFKAAPFPKLISWWITLT